MKMHKERSSDDQIVKSEETRIDENEWKRILEGLPKDQAERLRKAIEDEMAIPPKVAVIGKSGVGKTTTINSLFDVEWHTSENITGTMDAQKETFQLKGGGKLTVIDMPGLGDSITNDAKFMEIYQSVLPDVDVIFYIIQADDRGLGEDERIIKEVLKCGKDFDKKFVIGINKVDLLGENEGLEWDDLSNLPLKKQKALIERKCADISKHLSNIKGIKKDAITYYSAIKRYNLYHVLYAIVTHSGILGWKIAVQPKDWKDLVDPRIKKLAEEKMQRKD